MWNMSIAAVLNPEGLGYSWKATPSPRAINACFWCQPNSTAASFHGYGIRILTCFWSSRVVTLSERGNDCGAALVMDKEPFFVLWLKRNELCTISYKQFSQEYRWQVRLRFHKMSGKYTQSKARMHQCQLPPLSKQVGIEMLPANQPSLSIVSVLLLVSIS